MSLFRYSDYGRKKERPKKTKLPTKSKSLPFTICPFCSKRGWSKKLRKCSKCGRAFTPDKILEYKKFRVK